MLPGAVDAGQGAGGQGVEHAGVLGCGGACGFMHHSCGGWQRSPPGLCVVCLSGPGLLAQRCVAGGRQEAGSHVCHARLLSM